MKRTVSFILALLICLSAVYVTGITVFAETEEVYSITLYEDSSKETVLLKKENLKEEDKIFITFEPTKEGHTFVSWVNAETNEKVKFINNIIVVGTESAEYYIDWEINTYKLVYRGYGEVIEEYDVLYGTPAENMPVPEETPTREGYEFIEWSALPETMPAQRTTVIARWRDTDLEVHFYASYGDDVPFLTVPLLYGDPIFEPDTAPKKTGYTFKGWSFDGKTVVSEYELGNISDEDVNIYGVWEANKYNATFLANGGKFADGSEKKVVAVDYNSPIEFNEVPTKDFCTFNGWTPVVGVMNNTNGINFRANWITSDDIYYSVATYVMGTDGKYTSTVKKIKGKVGTTVSADYTVAEGFELNKTRSKLSGVVTTDCSLVLKVYIDRKLYDFCVNIDGVKTEETYLYGENIPTPATPEKDGYIFIDWVPSVPATMPASDYTVTATWKKIGAPDHVHRNKTIKIEPTCTNLGKIYMICEICGETMGNEIVIAATGHKESEWKVVTEPTYVAEGKKIKTCLTCGETVEQAKIDKLVKPSEPTVIKAVVEIRNNPETVNLKYGETLRVYADTRDIPKGCGIEWSISGEGAVITKTQGDMCEVKVISDGASMLTVTVVDSNGEPIRNETGEKISDSQYIVSKAGIIQKIIAFFKKIFGLDKIIIQVNKHI